MQFCIPNSFGSVTVLLERDGSFSFSSTQVNLPPDAAAKLFKMGRGIPEHHLHDHGRETDAHVTLKYGLHTSDPREVAHVLDGEPPVSLRLGKTSLFPASKDHDYDVVKVDVDSDDLHHLNGLLSKALDVTDTYPEYKPHATVAYVKAGRGRAYEGLTDLEGHEAVIDKITFSSKEGRRSSIRLRGRK